MERKGHDGRNWLLGIDQALPWTWTDERRNWPRQGPVGECIGHTALAGESSLTGNTLVPEDYRPSDPKATVCLAYVGTKSGVSPSKPHHRIL